MFLLLIQYDLFGDEGVVTRQGGETKPGTSLEGSRHRGGGPGIGCDRVEQEKMDFKELP